VRREPGFGVVSIDRGHGLTVQIRIVRSYAVV